MDFNESFDIDINKSHKTEERQRQRQSERECERITTLKYLRFREKEQRVLVHTAFGP